MPKNCGDATPTTLTSVPLTLNVAANDVARAAELPRPEAVADHRHRVRVARAIVGGRQQPADLRLLPKRGEAFTGDQLDARHLANRTRPTPASATSMRLALLVAQTSARPASAVRTSS